MTRRTTSTRTMGSSRPMASCRTTRSASFNTLTCTARKALLVVKNGLTTGTIVGRATGLESFTRVYTDYDIKHTSIEVAILAYEKQHGPFSAPGDSGSIVLDRKCRIVGLLTGGGGTTDETDVTYATPYWWLNKEMKVKKVYPRCHLYDVVA